MLILRASSPLSFQAWEERRRQNIEKMNEEMEKIAEYERSQRVSRGGGGCALCWRGREAPATPRSSA